MYGANADIGITARMPTAGLCRIWRSDSSALSIWRYFPPFPDELNSA
jgi:hypothetical protein